jgi:hypothetical protein
MMTKPLLMLALSLAMLPCFAQAEDASCPEGREAACKEAAFQAAAYNVGAAKRALKSGAGADRATAQGNVFVLQILMKEDRKLGGDDEATQNTHLTEMFSKPLMALCKSPVHERLASVGGSYRTEVYDQHESLMLTINLDCEPGVKAEGQIPQR